MDCKLCREHIGDYLEKKLTPQAMQEFAHHLQQCPDCHREVAQTKQMNSLLDAWQLQNLVDAFDAQWEKQRLHLNRPWWQKLLSIFR